MGFKRAGFPHYSFNPLGFRTKGGFQQKLQDECGLLLGSTDLEIDRVGKSSRDAVQGVEIVGDGSTYIKNILLANLTLTYVDATTLLPVVSAWDANGEFIIPANGVAGLTTVYLTKTYTLDTHGDWDSNTPYGVYQLIPEDTSETILCQQYLAPVTPTQINLGVVSLHDKYGWSKAIDLLEKGIDATAEQEVIGIESTVGTDGQGQVEVHGLTVQNATIDNFMANVATYWTLSSATYISTVNGVGEFSPTSTNTRVDNTNKSGNVEIGDKIFYYFNYQCPTDVDGYRAVALLIGSAERGVLGSMTNDGASHEEYGIYTTDVAGEFGGWRSYFYATSTPSNVKFGRVFQIKMAGIFESYTEDQMLALVQTMQAGTDLQHLKNPDLLVTGKNLFNVNQDVLYRGVGFTDSFAVSNGNIVWDGTGSDSNLCGIKARVKPNTQYYIDIGTSLNVPASSIRIYAHSVEPQYALDGNVGFYNDGTYNPDFITGSDVNWITIGFFAQGLSAGDYIGEIQLSMTPIATYEPFKSSEMSIRGTGGADLELHSNFETFDCVDQFGRIYQRVDHTTNATLPTPIITDAEITIVDESDDLQTYLHLYENGQISGEAEDLLPIVKYRNLQGMTVPYQDRVTYDEAGDYPIDIETLIPNYENGVTSTAYVDGVHPSGVYRGRVKFDAIEDGTTWQIADKYHELIIADDTNILYDALGEPKELTIATQPNITEDKFFFDATTGKTLFFEESLTGDCKVKANSWMGFNEIFMVSDGEGGYVPYVVDGETMYVLKEGVTRV